MSSLFPVIYIPVRYLLPIFRQTEEELLLHRNIRHVDRFYL